MSLLDSISQPADLHALSMEELATLSAEIRTFIIEHMTRTGGHLSPNLGVVELTLALHRVFDSPRDKIIWDVGHQAYTHKIVTGRKDFATLRQEGGLSGYPSREESPHDFVENSHASTSLSYAMGLVQARENDTDYVIGVIGDGAITGGMAYEALNHIAHTKPKGLIIILNDNGRSYAPTVGGLAEHLARLRVDRRYEDAKQAFASLLRRLPIVGEFAEETAMRFKESVKEMLTTLTFFDVLGLKYTGPIDGHDQAWLEETLRHAKDFDEPVVIHVITDKGRGYEPAINNTEDKLHGVGRFDIETGKPLSNGLTMTKVFEAAILEAARRHDDLVAITAAMQSPTGLSPMAEAFPERVHDVGISEQHAVTMAAGLAMGGKRPIVSIYSSFLQRAFDQIVCDVALHDLPVVFVLDRAGVTGPDGPSHHGVFDLSYLRMIPNMTIGAPADELELARMVATAVDTEHPMAIRYWRGAASAIPDLPAAPFTVGRWERLTSGDDVLLLATGKMVEPAGKAASHLAEAGIGVTTVNARWVKPMDPRLPTWAAEHRHVVTVEDGVRTGGFGAGVAETLAAAGVHVPLTILGIPDAFLRFGDQQTLLAEVGLDADGIAGAIVRALAG